MPCAALHSGSADLRRSVKWHETRRAVVADPASCNKGGVMKLSSWRSVIILRGVVAALLSALCCVYGVVFAVELDFNGDGRSDILWRNSSTGENYVYLMNGLSILNEGYVRTVASQNWEVAGVADFNGDLRADILWRNRATGENYIYFMNGTTIANEGYLRTVADLNWKMVGVGDFDGDLRADILWR